MLTGGERREKGGGAAGKTRRGDWKPGVVVRFEGFARGWKGWNQSGGSCRAVALVFVTLALPCLFGVPQRPLLIVEGKALVVAFGR